MNVMNHHRHFPAADQTENTRTIAVVTLRTFALGKLDLLTVLPRET